MKNELTKQSKMEEQLITLSDDVFRDGGVQRKTTIDLTTEEGQDLYLKAQNDVDEKLNDHIGETIKVTNIIMSEFPNNVTNEETGEVVTRYKHTLILFDENNKSYVTGSNACFRSFITIAAIKGLPTKEHPLNLKVVQSEAKEKGHKYLRLTVA